MTSKTSRFAHQHSVCARAHAPSIKTVHIVCVCLFFRSPQKESRLSKNEHFREKKWYFKNDEEETCADLVMSAGASATLSS